MHVVDVDGCSCGQLPMCLAPRTARLISGEALARVLVHRVDVGIEGKRCRQHSGTVGVMVSEDDRRCVRPSRCLQTVLDARNDGFGHPFDVRFESRHGFTETNQKAHPRVFFHEGSNRLARVVTDERRDGTVAVLRLQSVVVGERLRKNDVVEHLNDADAPSVGFIDKKSEHLLVPLHRCVVYFRRERIIFQLHQRSERMAIP